MIFHSLSFVVLWSTQQNVSNSFKTTTVSSSQYYTSQVSATPQTTNYNYNQPTQQPVQSQAAAGDASGRQRNSSGGNLNANLSGPRQYPDYQQAGMQQYYHHEPTQEQLLQQRRDQFPNPSVYNPADYKTASPAAPQGLAGYPQRQQPTSAPPAAPTGYQPNMATPVPASLKPKAVVGAWNDPPLIKPKVSYSFFNEIFQQICEIFLCPREVHFFSDTLLIHFSITGIQWMGIKNAKLMNRLDETAQMQCWVRVQAPGSYWSVQI